MQMYRRKGRGEERTRSFEVGKNTAEHEAWSREDLRGGEVRRTRGRLVQRNIGHDTGPEWYPSRILTRSGANRLARGKSRICQFPRLFIKVYLALIRIFGAVYRGVFMPLNHINGTSPSPLLTAAKAPAPKLFYNPISSKTLLMADSLLLPRITSWKLPVGKWFQVNIPRNYCLHPHAWTTDT